MGNSGYISKGGTALRTSEKDEMKSYIKRIADEMLQDCLESSGITVIQGPKWCGKTTTAIQAVF